LATLTLTRADLLPPGVSTLPYSGIVDLLLGLDMSTGASETILAASLSSGSVLILTVFSTVIILALEKLMITKNPAIPTRKREARCNCDGMNSNGEGIAIFDF